MVEYEQLGPVALLTINRPEARNAINDDVAQGFETAIDRLEAAEDVWIGIVAGAGPVFCAGADLKAVAAGQGASLMTKRGGFGGITRRAREKPLVAAVDGPALAGGCEVALACDLIVASTAASFGIPEVKRSLVAAAGGLFRLPRALPRNLALELAMTGDPISAERAYHFGMVNELCAPGEAVATAMRLAARICANAPIAVRESRKVVLEGGTAPDDVAWRLTNAALAKAMATQDCKEGPRAFIEKRPPRWTRR
jgi:enoyl-CoA hydratase